MNLRLDEIAKKLIEDGFSSLDFDKESFTNRIIEILDDKDLFVLISEEMQVIEDEMMDQRKISCEDYVGRFGQGE